MNTSQFDLVGFIMAVEDGEASEAELVEAMQRMIDSGLVWQLQGAWGRLAARLIRAGKCNDTHGVLNR